MIGISDATELWALHDVRRIADTPGSDVYRATQGAADSRSNSVIVKVLKPRGLEELAGMDFLEWRDGVGVTRLIARRDTACLLEDAGSQTLEDLRASQGEDAANAVFASVLAELHLPSQRPVPTGLTPLQRHFRALTEQTAPADSQHASDLSWAADLARGLLTSQTNVRPLHGDLHHENIMSRDGEHWLAIDPHGLIGDPAYDAANFFGNPLGRRDVTCNPARTMEIARRVAPVLGCDESKVLAYAAAHAALSACWSINDPVSEADLADAQDRIAFVGMTRDLLAQDLTRYGQAGESWSRNS